MNLVVLPPVEAILSPPPDEARRQNFLEFASILHDLLQMEDVKARICNDPSLPYFSGLTVDQQDELLRNLNFQAKVLEDLLSRGTSILNSTRKMPLLFLEKAGLTTIPELEPHLKDDDFLSIFNLRLQLIFLSPNHLQLMSYSFEDLFCRSWRDLFRRNELVTSTLVSRTSDYISGGRATLQVNLDIPPHFITELSSAELRSATCRPKVYAPIFRDGAPAGFIAVNRAASFSSRSDS